MFLLCASTSLLPPRMIKRSARKAVREWSLVPQVGRRDDNKTAFTFRRSVSAGSPNSNALDHLVGPGLAPVPHRGMGPRPSVAWWVRAAGAGRIRYPLLRRWRAEAGASPGPTTHDGQWLSAPGDCGRVARVWVVSARAPKGAVGGILEISVRAAAIPATQRAVRRPTPQSRRGTLWWQRASARQGGPAKKRRKSPAGSGQYRAAHRTSVDTA
jgi:hypothetical protein